VALLFIRSSCLRTALLQVNTAAACSQPHCLPNTNSSQQQPQRYPLDFDFSFSTSARHILTAYLTFSVLGSRLDPAGNHLVTLLPQIQNHPLHSSTQNQGNLVCSFLFTFSHSTCHPRILLHPFSVLFGIAWRRAASSTPATSLSLHLTHSCCNHSTWFSLCDRHQLKVCRNLPPLPFSFSPRQASVGLCHSQPLATFRPRVDKESRH
jgi:hypothetical protein